MPSVEAIDDIVEGKLEQVDWRQWWWCV